MLIIKFNKIVILTTCLLYCLSHMVQSRYTNQSQDRNQNQSFQSEQVNLKGSSGSNQQSHSTSSTNHQLRHRFQPNHHRHRHHHNLDQSNLNSQFRNIVSHTSSTRYKHHNNRSSSSSKTKNIEEKKHSQILNSRQVLLYNRCSRRHLKFFHKSIDALGQQDNKYALMSLETFKYGKEQLELGVRILSKNAGAYLCFNNTGKLITKYNGDQVNCKFKEVAERKYFKYQSLYNPDWFIGFNRNGKPIRGKISDPNHSNKSKKRKHQCYHFVKTLIVSSSPSSSRLND